MKAAGLNPMLAYSQGGASQPAGAGAQMQAASMGSGLRNSASTAIEATRLNKELDQADSQIKLNDAAAGAKEEERFLNLSSAQKLNVDRNKSALEQQALQKQMPAIEKESKARQAEAELKKEKAEIDKKAVKYDAIMNRVNQAVGTANSAAGVIKPKIQIGGSRKNKSTVIDKSTGEILDEY